MGKTVLIVEDEQNIVDILAFNLSREGYDTMEAYDGATGLQLALEHNPDLILLDLMLPEMNGFEVCRRIRETGSTTPVLMLTAREGTCSTCLSPSQARLYQYTLRTVTIRAERTLGSLRYAFGGDHPSQTTHQTVQLLCSRQ